MGGKNYLVEGGALALGINHRGCPTAPVDALNHIAESLGKAAAAENFVDIGPGPARYSVPKGLAIDGEQTVIVEKA